MKRNIFKALAALTALVFASCTMGNTIEKQNDNTDGKTAYITIGLNEIARTALPGVENEDDFDSFKLIYNRIPPAGSTVITIPNTLGQWTGDESKSAYKKMTAEKFAVTSGKSYKFTLTATKGGATWQGEITKAIETGENSLSFKLSLTSLTTEGEGSLCITLSVPDAVKSVDAKLKTMDESQTISPADAALNFADGKATYTASGIAAGNYVLVYSLYGENKSSLGQWREYAGIADGLTSSSNPVIASNDSLAKLYKITLNLNGGTFNGTLPGSYTRYDCVGLPYYALWMDNDGYFYDYSVALGKQEIYRKNYLFDGWYDAETGGNLVGSIPFGSTGDITLWAHWTDTLTVPVDKIIKEKSFVYFSNYLAETLFILSRFYFRF